MAKFIKIKKENFASSLNYTADMLIGVDSIALVKKGTNSAINSDAATIFSRCKLLYYFYRYS